MNEVADNQFLQLRGKVWSYYRRVPTALVAAVGSNFIKKSLRTSDIQEARKLRNLETVRIDAWFERLANAEAHSSPTGSPPKSSPSDISYALLEEHVRRTVNTLDRKSSKRFSFDPPVDSEELKELKMNAEVELGILKSPDDPRRDEWIAGFGERILTDVGAEIKKQEDVVRFGSLIRRALIELQVRKLDRYDDRHLEYSDPLFDPQRPPAVRFAELTKDYLDERLLEGKLNNINRKTLDKDEACCRTLIEIIGPETPVSTIDYDMVRKMQVAIARLPSNRTKRYPGKSLNQILKLTEEDPESWILPLTQRKYLDIFEHIMALALKKRLIPSNPALDIKPLKRDEVAPEDKRKPWRAEQLKAFFEGRFYKRFAPDSLEPYTKADTAWRFWFPLILLYSGARPNEVAQLTAGDFQRTEKGTLYINFLDDPLDDDESGKRRKRQLKTETSRRCVPIHSMLIGFGLLDFVYQISGGGTNPSKRLFPTLEPNKYENYAWYALRRLNEHFFKEEMERDKRQSTYSFRHNVRDALRAVDAPASALKAITGWSAGSKSSSENYGNPNNPDFYAKWVEKIQFDLDLSFLEGAGARLHPAPPKRRRAPERKNSKSFTRTGRISKGLFDHETHVEDIDDNVS